MQGPITTFGSGTMPGSNGTLDRSGKPNIRRFYGKYRGKVADNIDPLFLGRILPIVPAVSELPLTWATPCVPYAGPEVGFSPFHPSMQMSGSSSRGVIQIIQSGPAASGKKDRLHSGSWTLKPSYSKQLLQLWLYANCQVVMASALD